VIDFLAMSTKIVYAAKAISEIEAVPGPRSILIPTRRRIPTIRAETIIGYFSAVGR
jgi:hypothetical protein